MFTRLLVPLDGSEAALAGLMYAGAIRSEHVRLLTVLPGGVVHDQSIRHDWREEWRASFEAMLEKAAEPLRQQGCDVEIALEVGDPADVILEHASEADLVIMTTRGFGAGRRILLGSTADRVARSAQAPVMLIRGGDDPVTAQPVVRVVVGLDGSELAEQSLPFASRLGAALGVDMLLARAVDIEEWVRMASLNASPVSRYAVVPETIITAAAEYLDDQATALSDERLAVETVVLEGSAAAALDDALLPGDILVLTSHGRGGIGRWMLGSVADKLVRHANTPVVIVRSRPES